MSDIRINQLIDQMRALSQQAKAEVTPSTNGVEQSFSSLFTQSLNEANNVMIESGSLKEGFDKGDPNISLAQVMIADQKSTVAFQTVVQVRNKLVQAYSDIMNMPI